MSLIPLLNILWESVGSKIRLEGLVCISLPCIKEVRMVGHVLADRGEVDTGGDAETRELGWITNSREHKKLWSVDHPSAQDDLFSGRNLPPLTLCLVSKRMLAIGRVINSLESSVASPNSTPLKQGIVEP